MHGELIRIINDALPFPIAEEIVPHVASSHWIENPVPAFNLKKKSITFRPRFAEFVTRKGNVW
jgi:hypothetical protein